MNGPVDMILFGSAMALTVPSAVFFIECTSSLLPNRRREAARTGVRRVAVLIPAHDEEAVIGSTLDDILPELLPGDVLLVVADNCSDRTASIARSRGASTVERNDPERRGKGYALEFGIARLSSDPPDVLVVIDADCRVERGAIRRLAEFAAAERRPAQADNLLALPHDAAPLTSISALAFLVRNRVRPTGLERLGLPCQLMGCGMALPWEAVRAAPSTGSHLVEDMIMGIELAARGFPPVYCTGAHVTSPPPRRTRALRGQRRRWEYGHLSTLIERAPKLIGEGLAQKKVALIALGLDLLVPPLALLTMLLTALFGATLWRAFTGGSNLPLAMTAVAVGLVVVGALMGWLKFGRHVLPARHLLALPFYVAWKLPLYLSFVLRGGQGRWERTERGTEALR